MLVFLAGGFRLGITAVMFASYSSSGTRRLCHCKKKEEEKKPLRFMGRATGRWYLPAEAGAVFDVFTTIVRILCFEAIAIHPREGCTHVESNDNLRHSKVHQKYTTHHHRRGVGAQ